MNLLICHLSFVTCHLSTVNCHLSIVNCGEPALAYQHIIKLANYPLLFKVHTLHPLRYTRHDLVGNSTCPGCQLLYR